MSAGAGSTRLLLVAHAPLATALREAASSIIGNPPLASTCVDYEQVGDERLAQAAIEAALAEPGPILVLVDVAGATPCNQVCRLADERRQTQIVAGLGLAMLLRVYNYYDRDLTALATLAAESGQRATQRLT